MKRMPRSTVSLESRVPLIDLVDRLSRVTSKKEVYGSSFGELLFHGRINSTEFRIQEITGFMDPANPIAHGKIQDWGEKRRIEIEMKSDLPIVVISAIFGLGVLVFFAYDAIRFVVDSEFTSGMLIPPSMLVFIYFFFPFRFYKKCKSITKKIAEAVDASIEQDGFLNSRLRRS